jgi:hypothetical protein
MLDELTNTATGNLLRTILGELQAIHATLAAAPLPASQPAQTANAQTIIFTADTITYGIADDGKPKYKALGGQYSKWGIRIWPEVLPLIGIDPQALQPGRNALNPPLNLVAEMGDNGPRKVIRKA